MSNRTANNFFIAWLFDVAQGTIELSRAIIGGSGDWEWSNRGGVQEHDRGDVKADGSKMEEEQSQQNGSRLLAILCRPMGRILERRKIMPTKLARTPKRTNSPKKTCSRTGPA